MSLTAIRRALEAGRPLSPADVPVLWEAPDEVLSELATAARDRLHPAGRATYLVMAIVNYTNVCVARCDYCAFYRLPKQEGSYLLTFEQVCERIDALRAFGGRMVGFNGGFHPKLRITDYAELFARIRAKYPDMEFYEMTVAEFVYSCKVSRVSFDEGARVLRDHGVRWVTGGGAEVLTQSFRERHSPLKTSVDEFYAGQRAILDAGLGSTATMVIGFDETLDERIDHLARLRAFQDEVGGLLPSFLCWTYKPWNNELGGVEIPSREYLRWLAVSRLFLHNIDHVRASVLTRNEDALLGLRFGADDFDLPTEDEVTRSAGATIDHDFQRILGAARAAGYEPVLRSPFPVRTLAAAR